MGLSSNAGYSRVPPGAGQSPVIPPTLADEFAPLPDNAEALAPSGDVTGVTDRAAMQTALTAGRPIYLVPGATYYLDQALTALSGFQLRCAGGVATIAAGSSWAGSSGTLESNVFIRAVETEAAQAATTVGTTATAGSSSIVVGSATGFAASAFFKVTGISGAQDFAGQSAHTNAPAEELLRASSAYAGGTTVALESPTICHHGANGASKPVKLLSAVVDGGLIEGIRFDGTATEVVYGALQATFARRIVVRRCETEYLTGYAFSFRGSKHCHVSDIINRGAVNGLVSFYSCQDSSATNCRDIFEVWTRNNTSGSAAARYRFRWRAQCRYVRFIDCHVTHAVAGFQCWGGVDCELDGTYQDLDGAAIALSYVDETAEPQQRGVALDTSGGDAGGSGNVEFGFHSRFKLYGSEAYWSTAHRDTGGSNPDDILHYHGCFALVNQFNTYAELRHDGLSGDWDLAGSRRMPWGCLWNDSTGWLDCDIVGANYGYLGRGSTQGMRGRIAFEARGAGGNFMAIENAANGLPSFDYAENRDSNTVLPVVFFPLTPGTPLHVRPLFKVFQNIPIGIGTSGTQLPQGTIARDVYVMRLPDSAGVPKLAHAYDIDNTAGAGLAHLLASHTAGGKTQATIIASEYFGFAGVQRYVLACFCGPGMCAPQKVIGALNGRQMIESDANGAGIAATAYDEVIGQLRTRSTADSVVQCQP